MLRRTTAGLAVGAAAVAALGAVWLAAFHSPDLHALDGDVFARFRGLQDGPLEPVARAAAALVDTRPFALTGMLLIVVAYAQGRTRAALIAGAVLVGANVTTQGLKAAVTSPRFHPALGDRQLIVESWPSGHATAAMAVVLVSIIVAPPSWRVFCAGLGAVYVTWAGASVMILGWHYPSDVAAGFLVATTWAALGVAAGEPDAGATRTRARWRGAGIGAGLAGGIAIVADPDLAYTVAGSLESPAVALGTAAIGIGTLVFIAARRRSREPRPGRSAAGP